MKRTLAILVAFLCVASASNAQNWKAEAGFGMSKFVGSKCSAIPSYQIGVGYEIKLWNDLSIIPHTYVIRKGAKNIHKGTFRSFANYIEFPIVVAYRLHLTNEISLLPQVGAYFAYGLYGNTRIAFSIPVNRTGIGPVTEEYRLRYNTFNSNVLQKEDYGIILGFNGEYKQYTIGVRFDFGIATCSHINKLPIKEETFLTFKTPLEVKNRTLIFSLGYKF